MQLFRCLLFARFYFQYICHDCWTVVNSMRFVLNFFGKTATLTVHLVAEECDVWIMFTYCYNGIELVEQLKYLDMPFSVLYLQQWIVWNGSFSSVIDWIFELVGGSWNYSLHYRFMGLKTLNSVSNPNSTSFVLFKYFLYVRLHLSHSWVHIPVICTVYPFPSGPSSEFPDSFPMALCWLGNSLC